MKNLIYLSLFAFIISCGGEEEVTDNETATTNEDTTATIDYSDSLWVEEADTNEVDIFLDDFPSEWIMLTDVEGNGENMVIEKWCDAETPFFYFEPGKGEDWKLGLSYGQDGELCEVIHFEATESEQEGMQVINGSIEFRSAYDEANRFVPFWYNRDEVIGNFEGMGMQSSWFVPKSEAHNFEIVEEDCSDFMP